MFGYIESSNIEKYSMFSSSGTSTIPNSYKLKDLGEVWDQGSKGSCVSCSISEMYNFYQISHNKTLDIPFDYLYDKREDKSIDGMMPTEGFEILKKEGKINTFSRIGTLHSLKESIIVNGPALIALIAKSNESNFWNGPEILGGHAVSVVGYDEEYLIIKNSWGITYGDMGYWYLPYSDFNKVREAWTIIN